MPRLTKRDERAPSTEREGSTRLREWAVGIWAKGESLVQSPRLRIRPQVSLLAGSVLVLLTLYLPTAVDSCGSPEPGLNLASGNADIALPGLWGWLGTDSSSEISRGFYLFCLVLVALTLIFLLASVFRRNPVRKRRLLTSILAISGLTALLSATNLFIGAALVQTVRIFGDGTYLEHIAFTLLLLLFPVACLRPEFRTKKGALIWMLILGAISSATCYGDAFLSKIYPRFEGEDPFWTVTMIFTVSLLPLALWFRYALLGRVPRPLWRGVKGRLAIFYAAVIAVDLLSIAEFSLWGLIAFLLGLYLIFFGYWQMRRFVMSVPTTFSTVSAGSIPSGEALKIIRKRRGCALIITSLLVVFSNSACLVKKIAINKIGDAIASGGTVYSSDDDPELVREAVPFSLKLIESLLAESPRHRGLLLAACKGFTEYSYAFVQEDADELEPTDFASSEHLYARARKLYLRARDYGLRGLEVHHRGFGEALRRNPKTAVGQIASRKEVPLLYWTAASWGLAISISKDDPELIADQPVVEALIDRARALNDDFSQGAIESFLISYEPSRQGAKGDPYERSRQHFQRAIALSHGELAGPYVALAQAVSIQKQNRAQFESLLHQALKIDPDAHPEFRLENLVAQRRAKWLLSREDELIVPKTSADRR